MIAIELPQEMDFESNYDKTVQSLTAIRRLVELLDSYKGCKLPVREGANKRGNSSRLTQSFHFFMFEPIFSPVNALNQPI